MLLVPRNFKIDHLLRAITCGTNLRPQGTIFGLLMWAFFLFLNSAAGWRSAFSRGVGSSTEKCFAIASSAAHCHCRRRCNPMNLLQILASAFNALHLTKQRKKAKSQLERQRKPKKRERNPKIHLAWNGFKVVNLYVVGCPTVMIWII